ncbi:MAG: restriction endonuclease subunit S [Nitrososphaeria archaeon]
MNKSSNIPELPTGWSWTNVGEISKKIHYGYTASSKIEPVGPKMLRITDIQENVVNWDSVPYCDIDPREKRKYLLGEGDLVFARTGATVGKSYLIRGRIPEAVFASYLIRIILSENVQKEFVYYFFQTNRYWQQIRRGQIGIGQPNVNSQTLSKIILPLPPLNEQHRIVSRIEELFTRLDAGVESLKKVKVQLKRYHQAVLKYAYEGKLTEKWREEHKREIEMASALLEKIKEKRRSDLKTQQYEMKLIDKDNLFRLPNSWLWSRIGEIAEINPRLSSSSLPDELEVSFLPMSALQEKTGKYDLSIVKKYSEVKRGYTSFQNGDVLFAKITPCMENGKIAIVNDLKNGIGFGSTEFHVLRPVLGNFPREFLFFYLLQDSLRRDAKRNMTGAVGQLRVSVKYMSDIAIPLPPLEELSIIVREIMSRFSATDKAGEIVEINLKKAEQLKQSILKQAFVGKLVQQDPTDESAERSLERIREEKFSHSIEEKDITGSKTLGQMELDRFVK